MGSKNLAETFVAWVCGFVLTPKRILKSGNRTIVFWSDGTKTVVKRADDEEDNDYAAFTAALGIRLYGSNSALKRIVERTETQKPKKQKREKEKKLVEKRPDPAPAVSVEHTEWLFDKYANIYGTAWTCPVCKRIFTYTAYGNGVAAFCPFCNTGSVKEADSNG